MIMTIMEKMTLYVNPPLSSILIDTVITLFPHQLITTIHGNYNYNNGKDDGVCKSDDGAT